MKVLVVLSLIAVASCAQQPDVGCPAIETLAHRDAAADARAALARGDRHLLMLGGFAGEVPGVPNFDAYPTRMVEGTSDTTTKACSQRRDIAEAYATKYNQTVLQAPAPATAMSCSGEIGASAASNLVRQCLQVSPGTHPPCNAENSCEMIRSEIKRGCDYVGDSQPSFCKG